jgi:hypothetical protein
VVVAGALLVGVGFQAAPGRRNPDRVLHPKAAKGPLDNPLKGWCPGAGDTIHQPYALVFQRATWAELEPREGQYQFEDWERRWVRRPQDRHKHVVFRVHLDVPGAPSGVPAWLAEKGVTSTPYGDHGGGRSPDYNHPALVEGLERLIAAMGRRYDADPRVAFVQLGLLGFWGEWHTYPRNELFAHEETQRRVVRAYVAAFPHKILQARSARGEAGRQRALGFHDDLFPEDTDGPEGWKFLPTLRAARRADTWRRAAIGGELGFRSEDRWLGPDYSRTLEMINGAHLTYLGPYNPAGKANPPAEYLERCRDMVRRMGYEFALRTIRCPERVPAKGTLEIRIEGVNQGVAPFYYPWPVELALLDRQGKVSERWTTKTDVRTWLPGPFAVEDRHRLTVPVGRYDLALGIRDPLTDQPAVGFANDLTAKQRWTILATLEVSASSG